ncbi:hypothetical protein GA0115238_10161, partial [Streptomyces sp. di50b]
MANATLPTPTTPPAPSGRTTPTVGFDLDLTSSP